MPRIHSGVFFLVSKIDIEYMRQVLSLAEKGRGKTKPNPMVGALVVKAGRVIGYGHHVAAGKAHAEIIAMKMAGPACKRATLYLNLEPCCHTGRTKPCTDAIIKAGIGRVVFAVLDPDPRVNGRGAAILRKAGIEVTSGVLKREAMLLNDIFFGYHRLQRPFVTLKSAQTLDGRIATVSGDSKWITGEPARKFAHLMRAEVDGLVVGMGTVRADNPRLTTRHVRGANPYRIVVTNSLKFPRNCHLLNDNDDYLTIVAGPARQVEAFAKRRRGGKLIFWRLATDGQGRVKIGDLVSKANEFGMRSLLVEGGAELATSFLKAELVDKYVAITAPKLIGEGVSTVGDLGTKALAEAIQFDDHYFKNCGDDNIFVGYPRRRE
jgi:diaminohydroxyphosphoribosylaminopyrimidine deaminase/5-amino-6-(5-phosphoribosylamino)uracil reductase